MTEKELKEVTEVTEVTEVPEVEVYDYDGADKAEFGKGVAVGAGGVILTGLLFKGGKWIKRKIANRKANKDLNEANDGFVDKAKLKVTEVKKTITEKFDKKSDEEKTQG